MRVLLLGYGSRGDVQPMLVFGRGLKAAGYSVTVAADTTFHAMIESAGLHFGGLRVDVHAMMNAGAVWAENGRNPLQGLALMRKIITEGNTRLAADLVPLVQAADVLVSTSVTVGLMAAFAEKFSKQHIALMIQPFHPAPEAEAVMYPPPLLRHSPLNRSLIHLTQNIMWWVYAPAENQARQQTLGLPPLSREAWLQTYNQTRTLSVISRHVVPPSEAWGQHVVTTGYLFDETMTEYTPSPTLAAFLDKDEPPVFIGFGSMPSRDPNGLTRLILNAVERAGIRALIYRGASQLTADELPPNVMLFDGAPHSWLFWQVRAVVHHGGSGTTAAGLRAGKPALIVPHIIDQTYWGRRVYELGAGPEPIPRQRLMAYRLSLALRDLVENPTYTKNAAALGEKIRAEDGLTASVEQFKQWIGVSQ